MSLLRKPHQRSGQGQCPLQVIGVLAAWRPDVKVGCWKLEAGSWKVIAPDGEGGQE